jgi:superfamily I DNA/RNA helicase
VLDYVRNAEDPEGGKRGMPLFTKQEVKAFLNKLQVRFDPDGFKLAWAIACLPNHECLRTVRRIVMLVRPIRDKRTEPITRGEVIKALSLLFGQMGSLIGRWADHHVTVCAEADAA